MRLCKHKHGSTRQRRNDPVLTHSGLLCNGDKRQGIRRKLRCRTSNVVCCFACLIPDKESSASTCRGARQRWYHCMYVAPASGRPRVEDGDERHTYFRLFSYDWRHAEDIWTSTSVCNLQPATIRTTNMHGVLPFPMYMQR